MPRGGASGCPCGDHEHFAGTDFRSMSCATASPLSGFPIDGEALRFSGWLRRGAGPEEFLPEGFERCREGCDSRAGNLIRKTARFDQLVFCV